MENLFKSVTFTGYICERSIHMVIPPLNSYGASLNFHLLSLCMCVRVCVSDEGSVSVIVGQIFRLLLNSPRYYLLLCLLQHGNFKSVHLLLKYLLCQRQRLRSKSYCIEEARKLKKRLVCFSRSIGFFISLPLYAQVKSLKQTPSAKNKLLNNRLQVTRQTLNIYF